MRQVPEVGSEAAALLQGLREHLVLADVVVGHGAARELHRLLEVSAANLRNGVFLVHLLTTRYSIYKTNYAELPFS